MHWGKQFRMSAGTHRSSRKEKSLVAVRKSPGESQPQRSRSQVKNVRITSCTFRPANFFTRRSAYGVCSQRFATTAPAKVTAQNRPKRAGATPLLTAFSRLKFCGVAPARHAGSVTMFWRAQESENVNRNTGRKTKPTRRKRRTTWQSSRHHQDK